MQIQKGSTTLLKEVKGTAASCYHLSSVDLCKQILANANGNKQLLSRTYR